MLPRDTITLTGELWNSGSTTILTYDGRPFTIVGYTIATDGGTKPTEKIKVNDKIIGYNWTADKGVNFTPYIETNIVGTTDLVFSKETDNKSTTYVINYVPRDRTIVPDPSYEYSTTTFATSTPPIYYGFTAGEVLTNLFLFVFSLAWIFKFIIEKVKYDNK